jgi:hypothetical protein
MPITIKMWVQILLVARCTLCDKTCQWLSTSRFFPGTPPPINWPARINWNVVESGVKHHNRSHFIPKWCEICGEAVKANTSIIVFQRMLCPNPESNPRYIALDGSSQGQALNQFNKLLPIGPRAGFIYSQLFKYTQQHTIGFTGNSNAYKKNFIGPRTSVGWPCSH